jgi:hypothetical protein
MFTLDQASSGLIAKLTGLYDICFNRDNVVYKFVNFRNKTKLKARGTSFSQGKRNTWLDLKMSRSDLFHDVVLFVL